MSFSAFDDAKIRTFLSVLYVLIRYDTLLLASLGNFLAKTYFPQMNPEAAWHKLRSWLRENPRLQHLYAKRTRSFTPAEVSLIFAELGEP